MNYLVVSVIKESITPCHVSTVSSKLVVPNCRGQPFARSCRKKTSVD